jgi:uncharacterized membrane protein (DUF106 family)
MFAPLVAFLRPFFSSIFGGIFSGMTAFLTKIFGSGIKIFVRLSLRILIFTVFSGVIITVVDYFLNKIKDYSFSGLDPCVSYVMNVIGFFPALSIFVQIVAMGFFAKFTISYFKDSF